MFQKKFQAIETDGHSSFKPWKLMDTKFQTMETDGHKCVVEIVNKVQR